MPKPTKQTAETNAHPRLTYEVTEAREMFGQWRKVGETLELTKGQAKYYTAPNGAGLKLKSAETKAAKSAA